MCLTKTWRQFVMHGLSSWKFISEIPSLNVTKVSFTRYVTNVLMKLKLSLLKIHFKLQKFSFSTFYVNRKQQVFKIAAISLGRYALVSRKSRDIIFRFQNYLIWAELGSNAVWHLIYVQCDFKIVGNVKYCIDSCIKTTRALIWG